MTERRNKAKGGREEYRKKQHDNEKGSKGRWPAERKRGKRQKFPLMINRVHKQCH